MISIGQQIEEVEREIKQRERVYPRLVSAGKLKSAYADYQVQRMTAVLKTLEWVRDNRDALRSLETVKAKGAT